MPFDDRKLPAIMISIFTIVLLIIAFYTNFIPSKEEIIKYDEIFLKRDSNILNNSLETKIYKNNTLKSGTPCKIKTKSLLLSPNINEDHIENDLNSPNLITIIGKVELSDNLNSNILIKIIEDSIYTIIIPSIEKKGFILNLWNNSNSVKNIKTLSSFISSNMSTILEKGKLITMKPNKILILQSTGKSWLIIKDFYES